MNKEIYVAGGCFWGVQEYFSRMDGVQETVAGYANGRTENPSYEDVCQRGSGHAEAVKIIYDADVLSIASLIAHLFSVIDPLSKNRQGFDRGSQYRTGVYYTDTNDLPEIRRAFDREQQKHKKAIATELKPLDQFFEAEDYHQDYLKKNPNGYCHIPL